MRVFVSGVQQVKGVSSKTGNAFDMCNLITLQQIEVVSNSKVQIQGYGFKSMDLPLDPLILPQFHAMKFPCFIDVETEPRPQMGKFVTTVTGLIVAPAVLKTA